MTIDVEFKVLTEPAPALTEDQAAKVLREKYGLAGKLHSLTSERDQNFLLTAQSEEQFVLKIANSSEEASVTDFQTSALLHIADRTPELRVPRIVRTVKNETQFCYVDSDRRHHVVRVLTWLDGVPLQQAERTPNSAGTLGTCLARLGQALQGFEHPASGYPLLWDLKSAAKLRSLLDCMEDDHLGDLCADRLGVFERRVETRLDDCRWQVIHNDLNPSNVLVDSHNTNIVTGVIDFGDMVRSPLIADVAVAAAYLVRADEDPLMNVLEFVTAYNDVERLQPIEIDLLFDLILTRSVMTVLITNWRATRYPENREYILRNESRARQLLETMCSVSSTQVTEKFYGACGLN